MIVAAMNFFLIQVVQCIFYLFIELPSCSVSGYTCMGERCSSRNDNRPFDKPLLIYVSTEGMIDFNSHTELYHCKLCLPCFKSFKNIVLATIRGIRIHGFTLHNNSCKYLFSFINLSRIVCITRVWYTVFSFTP